MGIPGTNGSELSAGVVDSQENLPIYGVSGLFTVGGAHPKLPLASAAVSHAELRLSYGEDLDSDEVPAPGDFSVMLNGAAAAVSTVTVEWRTVVLTLESAVPIGGTVTVGYTAGTTALRTRRGRLVANFAATAVTNNTLPALSVSAPRVLEGAAGEMPGLVFEVTLEPSSGQAVSVDYADSGAGTATDGTDYQTLAGGTLTFAPGETAKTVAVTVIGDAQEEGDETVVLELGNAVNADLEGGGQTLRATGTIRDDEAPVAGEVPATWGLTPDGLVPGDSFRLLLVTGPKRNARPGGIGAYNKHVQDAAAGGRAALRSFSSGFRALVSTADVDARDNTVTIFSDAEPGVPIYWVGGDIVATTYQTFYDGAWASNEPRNENGAAVAADTQVFTGSNSDGTAAAGDLHAGHANADVRVGIPGTDGSELSAGMVVSTTAGRFYGLSGVFTVSAAPAMQLQLVSATVNHAELTLAYGEELDPDEAPSTGDFEVVVDGVAAPVSTVAVSGRTVTLTLASAVPIGGTVTVSYTAGTTALQTLLGKLAADFSATAVTNETQRLLSVSAPSLLEGAAGDLPALVFEVTLEPASGEAVSVDYADSGAGTATSGTDYQALTGGTLAFAPGETAKTVSVTVIGDAQEEGDETVVLELSNAVNAGLEGGGQTLRATGTIIDDEAPVAGEVPVTWGLTPDGLVPGNSFRLLLVTGPKRNARSGGIGAYNKHVQDAAAGGRAALRSFSSGFRALVSTAGVDGRDNTVTIFSDAEPGVPIYWVGGDIVATTYQTFYDGAWDSNEPRNEHGTAVAADTQVFTGSNSDGTAAAGDLHAGHANADVRVGIPGTDGSELSAGVVVSTTAGRFYGLSGVFTVSAAPATQLQLVSATVNHAELTLTYGEDLDPDEAPSPGDFEVVVDDVAAPVSTVAVSGRTVTLTLASAAPIGGTVTVSYTAGTTALRALLGMLAEDFPATAVTNETQPVLSVSAPRVIEGATGGMAELVFEVTLGPASGEPVSVDYADSAAGTATSGTDYQALTGGTLAFSPNETAKTVSVTVLGDEQEEGNETVVLELSNAVNAELQGGGQTLQSTGTIIDDEAPVAGNVPVTWPLTPAGLSPGETFRLLFVTSGTTNGRPLMIENYDDFVQQEAADGSAALRPFSQHFRVLASTDTEDARDHTLTLFSPSDLGVPIYWLGGAKIADDYRDLYDGSWAVPHEPRNQDGDALAVDVEVFTGSESDGTKADNLHLGQREGQVRGGSPGAAGSELSDSDLLLSSRTANRLYALSAIFTVVPAPTTKLALTSAEVNGAELTLSYEEDLDPTSVPAPADFSVTVAGSTASVASVSISGRTLALTLANSVAIGDAVTASYTAGTNPARTVLGQLVAEFSEFSVTNNTQPTLSINAPRTVEPDSGQTAFLDFEIALSPPADALVTVDYAVSEAGTATSGVDHQPLPGGTLSFAPGDSRRSLRVTVIGDEREESDETVVLELSNAVNAALRGGGTTLEGTGTIIDDEAPSAGEVPVTWGLAPSDLVPGDQFRLLFVTSSKRNARPPVIGPYDKHVQGAASSGRAALEPFGDGFRALASTQTDDARDLTATSFSTADPGVPIYWVGGARVADNYRDLYDGGWASNEPTDENGSLVAADVSVYTGSESDGTTAAGGLHIGHSEEADVRAGSPGKAGGELSDGVLSSRTASPLYGLSAVFTLAAAPSVMLELISAVANWSELTLTYASDLDADYAPLPGEFNVIVDGVAATVVDVSVSGARLTLMLAEPVPIGGTVTASYAAGARRLRSVLGVLVADIPPLFDVRNDTQAQLSVSVRRVAEGGVGDQRSLDFDVSLRPALAQEVTVAYADVSADQGTATSGTDYLPLSAGTLRFAPQETSKTVRVTVLGDALPEADETVVLSFSEPTNAAFATGGTTLEAEGTITNDDVPVQEVVSTWGLVPSGMAVGESFRLLFVTSSSSRGVFARIDRYDRHVRDSALGGRAAIRPFNEHLWALISTEEVDAREHTVSGFTLTDPGVPIYWLNGARVANDNRDFYDGIWASNAPLDEFGDAAEEAVAVFTGSASDGSRDPSGLYAGSQLAEEIRLGYPHVPGSEIASQDASESTGSAPVYALSGVFTVVAPSGVAAVLVSATVEDEKLTLTYQEDLDFDSVPGPADFAVTVEGAPRAVTHVTISGATVILTLASEVALGEVVAVSHTSGTNPLRTASGTHVAELLGSAAQNLTKRKLLIGDTAAFEGDPLTINATLSPASDQTVTVQYRTESGTAAAGVDFVQAEGTLTFSPGETSQAFTVQTIEDDLDEPNETFAVILSNATNLVFADEQAEVTLAATILDDDETVPLRVPPTWELVPGGLADGDAFRLLFVSSKTMEAVTESIALYDRHVIEAAGASDGAIQAVSQFFWVLASVAGIDARDYTTTTYTTVDLGVPIYWLGGARVADDYEDFYDGEWASNSPTDEFGERVPAGVEVFTGSSSDGTKDSEGRYLGTLVQGAVSLGKPGVKGLELDADDRKLKSNKRALYGLSGVFIVDKDARVPQSANEATLEIAPASVAEGSDGVAVTVTLDLARPARTDQEWEIQVRDETAFSPEDFEATPRSQAVSMVSGDTTTQGTFQISAAQEPDGIPECPESVLVRAVGTTDTGRRVASASARLSIVDPEASEAFCGPPADGATVVLTPTGERNPEDPTPVPPTEGPGPPERLGTPAEFGVWTDRAGYEPGQQVRLFRSVDPKVDLGSYTFFYYLENTRTAARRYFAPGIRSTVLEPRVVDQFGMDEGAYRPAGFEPAVRDLIWAGAAPEPGAWRFVAEARSADATQIVKASHARFVVSAGVPRQIGDPDEPLVLTADRTLYSAIIYKLRGTLRVAAGATLTVEAGTLVEALGPEAMVVVERGGRIDVRGTRREPVVMTCDAPVGHREPGCWGGLALLGRAPADPGDAASRQLTAESERQYGGDAADDSSGSLRFLRVEFAGGGAAGGSPNPALGLYGAGSGTTIEFVQAHAGLGDGIAFRGGTASCRWCVSSGSRGDLLDWSQGWQGSAQHLFLRQGERGEHGIHGHGTEGDSAPSGVPAVFNATLVGGADVRPSRAVGDGIRLSGGAALAGGNWIVVGFRGLAVQAGQAEAERVGSGGEGFGNVILHGNRGRRGFEQIAGPIRPYVDFRGQNPVLFNARYEPSPDPRPARGSIALDGLSSVAPPATGGPWDRAPYAGAFGASLWTEEWTFFGREADLRFVRLPMLSLEAAAGSEGDALEFVVRMQPESREAVTVRYETVGGTATEGVDFARSAGTLTFPPGETARTISVPTSDDALAEEAERFLLRLSDPANAELAGRARALERPGTIYGNDMPPLEIPSTWRFVPAGLAPGDSFRLLFVSSTARDASAYSIAEYDEHVRTAAAAGHSAIRPYSARFRALGSTEEVAARVHTVTTHDPEAGQAGEPIYWVGGDRVADDYRAFYGGSWSSNVPADEFGDVADPGIAVFTGSTSDGTRDPSGRWLGTRTLPAVRIGRPGESGKELDAGNQVLKDSELRFYGLSAVFAVTQARVAHLLPLSATVDGRRLTLAYQESLDATRPPSTQDFTVKVEGVERIVSEVTVEGAAVALRLESPVGEGESVTVSYGVLSHRPRRLRGGSGALVAVFGDRPVINDTTLVLSVAPAGVKEGSRGEVSGLDFEFSLNVASSSIVTVNYQDTGTGTATSDIDYEAVADRTLTFAPGQVSRTVSVRVLGDDDTEPSETVVLRLSGAQNATLAGGVRTLEVTGAILNDDTPRISVPLTWKLTPQGLGVGDAFRLLFVSSAGRAARDPGLAAYDSHVRAAAAGGQGAIRPFSDHFQVLGSSEVLDARDHTVTRYDERDSGLPIYWLGGGRVADDYRDLYDGNWDSNEPTDEFGGTLGSGVEVFTGTASDGTRHAEGRVLGSEEFAGVLLGNPGRSGKELDSGSIRREGLELGLYGLSGVFVIVPSSGLAAMLSSATVHSDELRLAYGEALDSDAPPAAADFEVTVEGVPRGVLEVVVAGSSVTLRLAERVVVGESVSVTYTPGPIPLRTAFGAPAEAFAGREVANETPLELSVFADGVLEGGSGSTRILAFDVTLSLPVDQVVTVEYADSEEGTATPGSDYVPLAAGTLVFEPGEVSKTVAVTVTGDDLEEISETVILRLSDATNVELAGGGETLDAVGTIFNDDAQRLEVPSTWRLIPEGLSVGDAFRLLFVSSAGRDTRDPGLAPYDSHVRAAAAAGHGAVRPFSGHFRVLGSSDGVDARDHTVTLFDERNPGPPIYWLGGDRVADDYRDFYDGNWDSNRPRNESGDTVGRRVEVFTGTASDGTGHAEGRVIGSLEFAGVLLGQPGASGKELDSGEIKREGLELGLYGLSGVFVIVPPSGPAAMLSSATVNGEELRLAYEQVLDSDAVPAAADFEVTVGGVPRGVLDVAVAGASVTLRLAETVVVGESVAVAYTPGQNPLRTALGTPADSFSSRAVANETPLELSVVAGSVLEGGSGSTKILAFEVTLPVTADRVVAVGYADSQEGTATSGNDYVPLAEGRLVFEPGEVSKTVAVTVTGDNLEELSETVILRFSGATNAELAGGGETLDAVGTIFNDDAPRLEVPANWGLIPRGLAVGDAFRLLFVSSTGRTARDPGLAPYDSHVRAAAAAGHGDVQPFSDHFRVLASSDSVDARDNTVTLYDEYDAGPPIYWLGGNKVADDYRDFYDGNWDSNRPRNEAGDTVGRRVEVFTGTASDGTKHAEGRVLGSQQFAGVLLGHPGQNGEELDSGSIRRQGLELGLYGLSGIFQIVPMSAPRLALSSATVDGALLTLTYPEELDPDSQPDPGDFSVIAAGASIAVSNVEIRGARVTLALAGEVAVGDTVTVRYAPGQTPLRSLAGTDASFLANVPVENIARPELSIGEPVVHEGQPLDFVVTLSPASPQIVTVRYRTRSGTATEGADFVAVSGTLNFLPGETAKLLSITTLDDDENEAGESVSMVLSDPRNAWFAEGSSEAVGIGQIVDDETLGPVLVPPTWDAIPEGTGEGDSFRLLFVTSQAVDASSEDIARYDMHVMESASSPESKIALFGGYVRALASTHAVDARNHTATSATDQEPGVSVYWLGGEKVVDDYGDLYAGGWDSNEPKDEFGNPVSADTRVFTGSSGSGTKDLSGAYLGSRQAGGIRVGTPAETGRELDSGEARPPQPGLSLYGLTGVFRVDAGASLPAAAVGASLGSPSSVPREAASVTAASGVAPGRLSARAAAKAGASFPGAPGTSARFAIWTDRTAYARGQTVRLLRSVDPQEDDRAYTFFYYLENIRTGRRHYFAPETGAYALSEGLVDAFGSATGAFAARRIPSGEKELAWEGAIPEAGAWQFVAEARTADATRVVKTAHAKFVISEREPVQVGVQDGPVHAAVDQVWTSDTVYQLRGPVRVRSGATLVIEAGTLVQASGPEARIIVERGGRIDVRGTRAEPVVMTCDAPVGMRAAGCWGGLTLEGRAPASRAVGAQPPFAAANRQEHGAAAGGDSSGTLRYLRVEFAGGGSRPNPAVALHGVGSGTKIEFVQSHESLGNGIELRGGDARIDYFVSSGARGDSFAWSEGWHGEVRHLFVLQGPQAGHGIAATGSRADSVAAGSPTIFGATLVGGGPRGSAGAAGDGIRLDAGARLQAESLVVTRFAGTAVSAGGPEGREFLAGRSGVSNAIMHGNGGLYGIAQVAASVAPYVDFVDMDPELRNVRYERNTDPRPRIGSDAIRRNAFDGPPAASGLVEGPDYTGAFGLWNWTEEWTIFGGESDNLVQFESTAGRQVAQYQDQHGRGVNSIALRSALLPDRDWMGPAASVVWMAPVRAATSSPTVATPERFSVPAVQAFDQGWTSRHWMIRSGAHPNQSVE